jgi:DNA-binding CsgD family transcriptional regulator
MGRISKAEMEVVHLVLQGYTRQQTALHLGKSINTVKRQLGSVYAILGVRNVAELSAYFLDRKIELHQLLKFGEETSK